MHGKKNDCRPKSYLSFSCLGELKILLLNPFFMLCTIKYLNHLKRLALIQKITSKQEKPMTKKYHSDEADVVEQNLELISKIYQSFEALEETLGRLKLEEPLFITYIAKKSFANVIFNDIKKNSGSDSR